MSQSIFIVVHRH